MWHWGNCLCSGLHESNIIVHQLAVMGVPRNGRSSEALEFSGINAIHINVAVKCILMNQISYWFFSEKNSLFSVYLCLYQNHHLEMIQSGCGAHIFNPSTQEVAAGGSL